MQSRAFRLYSSGVPNGVRGGYRVIGFLEISAVSVPVHCRVDGRCCDISHVSKLDRCATSYEYSSVISFSLNSSSPV